jgi:hypothetical protein
VWVEPSLQGKITGYYITTTIDYHHPGKVSWGKDVLHPSIVFLDHHRFYINTLPSNVILFYNKKSVIYFKFPSNLFSGSRGKKLYTICPQKKFKNVDKKILNIFCYIG